MTSPSSNRRFDLQIDVSGSNGLPGRLQITASVFLPDTAKLSDPPVAIFALPGGGYSRGYFDMSFPGHIGYSQAEHHTLRGLVFIAIDPLGVGESSITSLQSMSIEDIAAANDAAVRKIVERLKDGTLLNGFPALRPFVRIGIGQSMGGGLSIIMQGRHRTYDAIATLGYSAIHTVLPQRSEAERQAGMVGHGRQVGRGTDVSALSLNESSRSTADYIYPFHWEDVPRDILDADMAGGYPIRACAPAWGSATIPNCVMAMTSPGFVALEAAAIEVPVFVGVGERDTVPDPLAEPSAFKRARDIGVFVVPRMAHMHNFATTRALLWDRIADWSLMVSHGFS